MKLLGGMDTMFVRAETDEMPLHVTGVLVLDPGSSSAEEIRDRIRAVVDARLPALPPLRWRLIDSPGGLGALRWIDDPDFDVDRHIHLAPQAPSGSWHDVESAAGEIASRPLDRDKAMWEMHVIGGLADGTVAVVAKFHHAFMDGGAGMELMAELFDLGSDVPLVTVADAHGPDHVPDTWHLLAATPADLARRFARLPAALASLTGFSGLVGALLPTRGSGKLLPPVARTTFNGPLGRGRAVALAHCSLADATAAANAYDVKVNDVVLAAVTATIRNALGPEQPVGTLVAAVPVSVRDVHPEDRFGNHTSAMMIPLPTGLDDPILRLEVVAETTRAAKAQHAAMGVDLLERWARVVPPWLISAGSHLAARVDLTSHLPPLYNLIVSNVAGPPVPIYLAGAEVLATYPLGPLLDGIGLNITVLSQQDMVNVGILCDPHLVPDPAALGAGFAAAIEQLAATASKLDPAETSPR